MAMAAGAPGQKNAGMLFCCSSGMDLPQYTTVSPRSRQMYEHLSPSALEERGLMQQGPSPQARQARVFAWRPCCCVALLAPFAAVGLAVAPGWPFRPVANFPYAPPCDAPVYYNPDDIPLFKATDFPSVWRHSRIFSRAATAETIRAPSTPAQTAVRTGIVPEDWGAPGKAAGIQKVGIVGAGPSGLMSAKLLTQAGFEVTIFEASWKVGGLAHTYVSPEGNAHDLATKWIPTYSISGPGATPLQQAIIAEVTQQGLQLRASGGVQYYDTTARQPMAIPQQLQECSRLKTASDFVVALNIFDTLESCPGVEGVYSCGVAFRWETLSQWIKRMDLGCFGLFVALYTDALGGGPSLEQFAGYALKSRSYFLQIVIMETLVVGGVFDLPTFLLPPFGNTMQQLAESAEMRAYVVDRHHVDTFVQGYQGFWDLFVKQYGLGPSLRLSEPVLKVEPATLPGGKVQITTKAGTFAFDHVVVAAPPRHSAAFLPGSYRAFWGGVEVSHTESCAWPTKTRANLFSLVNEPNVALHPAMCEANLGRPGGIDYDRSRMIAISNEFDDKIYTVLAYPRREDWKNNTNCRLVGEQLAVNGFDLADEDPLARSYNVWPSYVAGPASATWFRSVEKLQGKGGVSFVGEALAGNNVPAIIDSVTAFFVSDRWRGE